MGKASRSNLNDGGSQTIEDPVKAYIAHIKSTLMYLKRSMVSMRPITFKSKLLLDKF